MSSVLYILIPIAALAVVVVLVTGVLGFAKGGKFNKQYGNKLMQARVILQFGAVILLLLLALATGSGGGGGG
jgi:hypothetical protein